MCEADRTTRSAPTPENAPNMPAKLVELADDSASLTDGLTD
jgi:hypothetical protein